jgi:hypothetical protein
MDMTKVDLDELWDLLQSIRGGAESIQTLVDGQQAMLDLARDPQSGSYSPVAGGAAMDLYIDTDTSPYIFHKAYINMVNMQAADTLILRFWIKNVTGGAYTQISDDAVYTYAGVQVPAMKKLDLDIYNMYGIEITGQMTGTTRALECEYWTSKRGG